MSPQPSPHPNTCVLGNRLEVHSVWPSLAFPNVTPPCAEAPPGHGAQAAASPQAPLVRVPQGLLGFDDPTALLVAEELHTGASTGTWPVFSPRSEEVAGPEEEGHAGQVPAPTARGGRVLPARLTAGADLGRLAEGVPGPGHPRTEGASGEGTEGSGPGGLPSGHQGVAGSPVVSSRCPEVTGHGVASWPVGLR